MNRAGAVPDGGKILRRARLFLMGSLGQGQGTHLILFSLKTILILNDYKDAARRSAEGDRKALCSPPQRRNPFATCERDVLETN